MTDREQISLLGRGATLGVCAFGVSLALPAMSTSYEVKRQEASFRQNAERFANARTAIEGVQAAESASPLLQHDWVRRVGYSVERDPDSALGRYGMRDRDGAAVLSVASFTTRHMQRAEFLAAEHQCLAEAVYYEARSERETGQLAVAEVVANRVRDHRYPNTVCDVVYQGATRTTGCQFTFTCDGALSRKPVGRRWAEAKSVAAHVLLDLHERRTQGATHYHATYVNPVWNSGLVHTASIGTHIFYRFPRTGSEWRVAAAAMEDRRARPRPSDEPAVVKTKSAEDLNARQLSALSPAP